MAMQMKKSASNAVKARLAEEHGPKANRKEMVNLRRKLGLSRKELEVLGLLADGYKIKQVSYQLSITESAIKQRINTARKKLYSQNATQCVARAILLGLLEFSSGENLIHKKNDPASR